MLHGAYWSILCMTLCSTHVNHRSSNRCRSAHSAHCITLPGDDRTPSHILRKFFACAHFTKHIEALFVSFPVPRLPRVTPLGNAHRDHLTASGIDQFRLGFLFLVLYPYPAPPPLPLHPAPPPMSHTIFHTQLRHTQSFTDTLSHNISHTGKGGTS